METNETRTATQADRTAFDRLVAARPVWTGLAPAGDILDLGAAGDRIVLHAGPPIGPAGPCRPIANSVASAAIFEGWARDFDEAYGMLAGGGIELRPAQDANAAVPLASVITRSMIVQTVEDEAGAGRVAVSPLNGGSGPALRLGKAGADVVAHIGWLNTTLAEALRPLADARVDLLDVADAALAAGDDCHGRTGAATAALLARLKQVGGSPGGEIVRFFETSPSVFLNLWMAACRCIASAAEDVSGSSVVTALGANGNDVGVKLSGAPGVWVTAPAKPPTGALEAGIDPADRLGAIGDSALVDALGFGAMSMHHAPAQLDAIGAYMPAPSDELGRAIFIGRHTGFTRVAVRTGLSARRIADSGRSLAISLGIVDRTGERGRVGGGISVPAPGVFARALDTIGTAG